MAEEKKIKYHSFKCHKCTLTFGFDSEEGDVNKFAKSMNGIKCPKCGDIWGKGKANITHEFNPPKSARSLKARGAENIERSRIAHEQAARYAATVGQEEMVELQRRPGMGAPTQYGRAVERVPKKVLDNLEERITSSD